MYKLSTQIFIAKAKAVHGDFYVYTKTEYVNSTTKVTITCPNHGDFQQDHSTHLSGSGCMVCAKEKITHTKERFIEKAKRVHGDRYDYSDSQYKNNGTKIAITCPNHGVFYQTPGNHLSGYGCVGCWGERRIGLRRLTQEQFLAKAKETHGDKYDYTKSVYDTSTAFVDIICPKHGTFRQIATSHIQGSGCRQCSVKNYKGDGIQFLAKAKETHGDKYDYSKVAYVNAMTRVTIICPTHGEFATSPTYHLQGSGCSECQLQSRHNAFLQKAKEIHGDKYDYSKVAYVNAKTRVTIICPTHGEFRQQAGGHTAGYGCFQCGVVSRRLSQEEFIERATALHKGRYDYSEVNLTDRFTKVVIICPTHGEFTQTPDIHLKRCGCIVCNASVGERVLTELLNKHNIKYFQQHRIPGNRCRYDFYLRDHHLLIEFHGIQHYKFVEYFHGTVEEFNKRKLVDEMKVNLAKSWGIPLLVVNYKHLKQGEELIEKILLEFIARKGKKSK